MRGLATGLLLGALTIVSAADLSTKKALNLAVIKEMVAAAEKEAATRNVNVTIAIVDESGNLLFLQKADKAGLNTIEFAQRKAKHAAIYRQPSKNAADNLKNGNQSVLIFPGAFPNQGGLPIEVNGDTIGGVGVSGAPSEVDEAIAQVAMNTIKQ